MKLSRKQTPVRRFFKYSQCTIYYDIMRRKTGKKLPEAAIPMLQFLQDNGEQTQRDIIEKLGLQVRTVRYSIRRLLERELITKRANLSDMRSVYYMLNPQIRNLGEIITQELEAIHAASQES